MKKKKELNSLVGVLTKKYTKCYYPIIPPMAWRIIVMKESTDDGRDKRRTSGPGAANKTTHYDRDGGKTGETRKKTGRSGLKTMSRD